MEYKFSNKVGGLKASAIREILKFTSEPGVISFAAGNPAPEAFPTEKVAELSNQLWKILTAALCTALSATIGTH